MITYNLDSNHNDIIQACEAFGGQVKVVDNARVKRLEPGQLDFWWGISNPFAPVGLWIWCEIKTDSGKLESEQRETIGDCQDKGLPVEVLRTTADVEAVYEKYLAIMRRGLLDR